MPVFVTDDRGALCHSVSHSDREVYSSEEIFDFLVERSTASNDFVDVASECVEQLLAYLLVDDVAQAWDAEQELHLWCVDDREHFTLHNLLDDERYGNHE